MMDIEKYRANHSVCASLAEETKYKQNESTRISNMKQAIVHVKLHTALRFRDSHCFNVVCRDAIHIICENSRIAL